jgi:phosphonate transport system permease protein
VARETWRTVAIATAGITLALVLAVPLTLLSTRVLSVSALSGRMARGPFWLRQGVRWLLIVLRSVPELVWALVFVRVVGLGPTAGVLAIALTYGGMLGKVYGEILESGETHATETLLRNGSGRLQAFFYGLLPQNAAELTSYTVYRWECAIRSSVVLGFVGAGGLGQQMDSSMKMFNGGEVATMLLVFMALVALADRVSAGAAQGAGLRARRRCPPARRQPALPAAAAAVRRALQGLLVHAALLVLVVASFWSLDLQWAQFLSLDAARSMGRFLGEFFPPDTQPDFLRKVAWAPGRRWRCRRWARCWPPPGGLLLALPASRTHAGDAARGRTPTRLLLNALRSVPELVWAALLLIAAGLGPLPARWRWPAHHRRAGPAVCRGDRERAAGPGARCARRAWAGARVPLRHAAAGAAAADELHAVPLGEQHPRRRRAGRGGRRRAGAVAGLPHGPVPHGQDRHHAWAPCCCWWRWWTR